MSTSRSCNSSEDCPDSNLDDVYTKYNFIGEVDQDGLRNKYGYQTWSGPYQHKYAGNFLCNNMHDKGFYFIRQENNFSFFDGQFYNNKLEGYGQVIHDDGGTYEGLFKDNKRFGPGILTHTDGTQDIGFWNGNSLLRLSISASSDFIPTLCSSSLSKVKLLRFKKIVSAVPEKKDQAKTIMLSFGADNKFFDNYPELYNYYIRNENSSFFDRRYYDLAQLGSEVASIDVIEDDSPESLNFYDTVTEYDDICVCTNERCVHLNRQIDEIHFELEKIHNDIIRLKKKLRICGECCIIEEHESETGEENLKNDSEDISVVENVKYPSGIFSTPPDFSTKYKMEKNWNQMRLQSSVGNLQDEVPVLESPHREDIEKISVNEAQCDQSNECNELKNNDKRSLPTTCDCTDKHVPDIDFLISELEVLERNEKFHETVLHYLNNILCKEITATVRVGAPKTLQVYVEHLLAWNNDKIIIDMMQHCFRYRNFENMLSFNIKSLLSGDRTVFGEMGKQERSCVDYLKHCGLNQLDEVREDLLKYNINPDLSDARGNRGVHFAVTNDCYEVIEQLANVGANLDALNDECLTPLLLAILRYIATINAVTLWESAFLPEVVLNTKELEEVIHWRPHESLLNLSEYMGSSSHLNRTERHESLVAKKKSFDEIASMKSRKSTTPKINLSYLFSTLFIDDYIRYKKASAMKKVNEVDKKQIEPIERTISTLLHYGADPNVGEVPMCPVLLAIFTKNVDLVEIFLKNGANPNKLNEEGLSALHILASLPFSSNNVQISEKFLNYSCNPNTKTGSDYWLEQNDEILGDVSDMSDNEVNQKGKTALQMICMRKDFDEFNIEHQCALVRMLIDNGAIYDRFYLGHTLLSVAVLRENVQLIETLYPYVKGSRPLGENMGNAMTLLGLNRFSYMKSFTQCKQTIDKLVSLGMNPFDPVYTFPNVYEFFSNEYSEDRNENNRKIRAKLEAEYKKLAKHFESHEVTKNTNRMSVAYIREIGKKILSSTYQYKAIIHLLLLAEEDNLNNSIGKYKAKLLSVEDAINCMKILIRHENLELNSALENLLLKLFEFIRDCNPKPKARKKKKRAKTPLNLQDEISKLTEYDTNIPVPGVRYILDRNPKKYDVCYHCLKKSKKTLITCPLCGIAKFCSDICKKFDKKTKSKHPCNILFHDSVKSKKYNLSESSNVSGKEHATARSRRATLDPQKQKSEKSLAKQPCVSLEEIIEEEDDEITFDPCCIRKNSLIILCNENEYSKQMKVNCGFVCSSVVSDIQIDEAKKTEGERQFCVCYSSSQEQSEVPKLEEFVYNEDLKENLIEVEQKVNQMTEDEIIRDKFEKFLERFKKKPPEYPDLGNGQIIQHKTQDSEKLEYKQRESIAFNENQNGVLGLNKSMQKSEKYTDNLSTSKNLDIKEGQVEMKNEKTRNNGKRTNESISIDGTKFSAPFEHANDFGQKSEIIEEEKDDSKANKIDLKKQRKRNKTDENEETTYMNEKLFADGKSRNVGEDNMRPEVFVTRNSEKQLKEDHEYSAPSTHKDGKQKKKYNDEMKIMSIEEIDHNNELNKQQMIKAKTKLKEGDSNAVSRKISTEEVRKKTSDKVSKNEKIDAHPKNLDEKDFFSNDDNERKTKTRRKIHSSGGNNETMVNSNFEKTIINNRGPSKKINDHEYSAPSAHKDGKQKKKYNDEMKIMSNEEIDHNNELNKQQMVRAKTKLKEGASNAVSRRSSTEEVRKKTSDKVSKNEKIDARPKNLDQKDFFLNDDNERINKTRSKIHSTGGNNETIVNSKFEKAIINNRGPSKKIKTTTTDTEEHLKNDIQNSSNRTRGEKEIKTIRTNRSREREDLAKKKHLDKSSFSNVESGGKKKEEKSKDNEEKKWQERERMRINRENEDFKLKTENNIAIDAWMNNHGSEGRKTVKKKAVVKKRKNKLSDQVATFNNFKGKNIAGGQEAASAYSNNFAKFEKFPKLHQYFLELLAQYFPDFNLNGLLFPFACFVDGQLYYKFTDSSPYYCRTYSTV